MILVRTPFRVSFAGGGSDMAGFYRTHYGAVVSTTINKYMYVMIHPYFHDKIRIKYSKTEDVSDASRIRHPLVRECLKLTKITRGVEIASIADVPAGTGLGSSSAFTVGLLHALALFKKQRVSKQELARNACRIEIEKVGEPIGKQDQYASSFGGLNFIRFNPSGSVSVEPVRMQSRHLCELQRRLLLFYSGQDRNAGDVLREQKSNVRRTTDKLLAMVKLAEEVRGRLETGDLEGFADCLHRGWLLKRQFADSISNRRLDAVYEKAHKAKAKGKLLGAGGGGFFLFYCEPARQQRLREELGLRELKFSFEEKGTQTVYHE
jgi:D-glycero-alpha-D-manno-heptose-7-phosphate kinase